ncbi:AAA family ATPase [Halobacteriales archaeon QS_4_70_19]|nr:MAG: AAA family ATPase [Halobacteriales archaeon QS_4_70_19]
MDWTEKYRPTTLSEVRGNDTARDAFHEWARTWDDHREAVILYGAPGVGKTSAAHALASDMGWSVMELNASDSRTADRIETVAGGAAMNQSLTSTGRQLVVLDEADNLHQHKDRGGARAMTKLVKSAEQPVVLVANDFYEMSRGLRNACRDIEFRDVSKRSILPVLRDICRKEDLEYESDALEAIAATNDGDLRGAIKDLQAAAEGRDRITEADVSTGSRDRTQDIFSLLDAVLKEQSPEEALRTAYDTDETPDDLLQWVEDKVPKVYEGDEVADAYGYLARADRWLGRVRATQNYTYWRYATDNIAAGVAAARQRDRSGWTRYGGAPYRSYRDSTRDYVAERIAESAGVSTATARREIMPFLSVMTHHCKNRGLTVRMVARYELDAEHVSFITGSGESTNKVQDIVADADERREQAAVDHSGGAFAGGDAGDGPDDDADGDEADADGSDEESVTQATLGGADESDDGDEDDRAADAEAAADDDQQSGLGDFM